MSDNEVPISHWDYRILRGEDGYHTIGEVYYDSKGDPVGWTDPDESVSPFGETVEELISSLKSMLSATNKPVFTPPKENQNDRDRN